MEPFHLLSATDIAVGVASGNLSVSGMARAMLERVDSLDGALNAWVSVDRERVLAQALALDDEARSGALRGPLHGVAVAIKDIYDVAGMPTRAGSRVLANVAPAERDSAPVARLRRAGALIAGKTATTEFASADPAATTNPWNAGHTPGGSSSGSAAAVAAGMIPVAMGSQTGGSILRPAAFCGIVGFKPSFGRVPCQGVLPFAWSLDTMGPLTRTVADAALVFRVLAGAATPPPGAAVAAPRIGHVPSVLADRLDPRMHEMLASAANRLGTAGAAVEETLLPPDFAAALNAHHLTMIAEAAAFHAHTFPGKTALYGPRIRGLVEAGALVPAASYLQAQRVRRDLFERLAPLLTTYDALLVPAAAGPAPETLESTGDPAFNAPWTMLGLPAIALYGGVDVDGMPLGLQLVGRAGGDEALLQTAAWCEQALGTAPRPPAPFN